MITDFLHFIKSDANRTLPKWERLNNDLKNRQSIQENRFLNIELPDAPHVVLIEQMIKTYIDDIRPLFYLKDNFRRCVHLLDPKFLLMMEQRIDSIRTQPAFIKTFFYPSVPFTVESIIPVTPANPLFTLPLKAYESAKLKDLKPIRIWYANSKEFISNLVPETRPRYKSDVPSIGIVTVDFLILTLKLLDYIDRKQLENAEGIRIREFLRDEVFVHFHQDLREMWLLSFIDEILDMEDKESVKELCRGYADARYTLGDYSVYAEELFGYLQDMKEGAIDPSHLLHAKLLEDRSIIERSMEAVNDLTVRGLRQYKHLDLSIKLPILKTMIKFVSYSANPLLKRSISIILEREIRLIRRTQVHHQYRNKILKGWLESMIEEIYAMLTLMHHL